MLFLIAIEEKATKKWIKKKKRREDIDLNGLKSSQRNYKYSTNVSSIFDWLIESIDYRL